MRILALILTMTMITSCIPNDKDAVKVTELALYSNSDSLNVVNSYFFGKAKPITMGMVDDKTKLDLKKEFIADPMYIENALSVNGKPFLQNKLEKLNPSPAVVSYIPLTTDLRLVLNEDVDEVAYFDGGKWFSLINNGNDGFSANISPKQRLGGLHGFADLNNATTDMLMRALEPKAPIAITALIAHKPNKLLIDGLKEYKQAAIYVQENIQTDVNAYKPPAEKLVWDILAEGNNAVGDESPEYLIIQDQSSLLSVWNRAYGNQLSTPPMPDLNFDKETIVAIFMGQKSTGGYALALENASIENNELFLDIKQIVPGQGAITTMALTHPWMIIRILRGGLKLAWLRDPVSHELFGVAKP